MKAWFGLLEKEYRLSRMSILIGYIVMATLFLFSFAFDGKQEFAAYAGVMMIGSAFIFTFYMAGFMLFSLKAESNKLQLWLHSPHSALKLLLAKFTIGLASLMVAVFFSIIYFRFAGSTIIDYFGISVIWPEIGRIAGLMIIYLIAASIYIGAWAIFTWTIYKVLKQYIGKISFIVTIILLGFIQYVMDIITETEWFGVLTNWGGYEIQIEKLTKMYPNHISVETGYVGNAVFYLIFTIGLFLLSSWIIDRKIEV